MDFLQKEERVSTLVQSGDVLLSLSYIRDNVFECLGKIYIQEGAFEKWCATIPGILFENGDGSWSGCAPYNFDTRAQALEDYFWRLRTTRKIKKGDQDFVWNKEEQRFEEVA